MPENRNETGQFIKGASGNPGGRPAIARDFKERCREFMCDSGFQTLIDMANNPKDRDRFRAIELIAGYGLGKPKQGLDLSTPEGGLTIKVRLTDDEPD